MTAANIMLIANQHYHLFSVGSDGYPDSIDRIVSCCEAVLQPDPEEAPDGVSEFVLRTDACYVYLVDFDRKQARCWRNRNGHSGETLRTLLGQTRHEIDLSEFLNRLPDGWRVLPNTNDEFGKQPVAHLRTVAVGWDAAWSRLDWLDQHLGDVDQPQDVDRLRATLPLIPLTMPYREPVFWLAKKVHYLTREGIWIEISSAPWKLACVSYEQLALTETERIFSAWFGST